MGIPKQILAVDDDEQILFVWRGAFLEYEDQFHIETAQSGEEALELVMQTAFDLVVTDIRIPGMNGYELTEAIRQLNQDLPVIWITGFPNHKMEARAALLGVHRCLSKPISIARIREVVAEELLRDSSIAGFLGANRD
jgi:two-component system response regulator YesN